MGKRWKKLLCPLFPVFFSFPSPFLEGKKKEKKKPFVKLREYLKWDVKITFFGHLCQSLPAKPEHPLRHQCRGSSQSPAWPSTPIPVTAFLGAGGSQLRPLCPPALLPPAELPAAQHHPAGGRFQGHHRLLGAGIATCPAPRAQMVFIC